MKGIRLITLKINFKNTEKKKPILVIKINSIVKKEEIEYIFWLN